MYGGVGNYKNEREQVFSPFMYDTIFNTLQSSQRTKINDEIKTT